MPNTANNLYPRQEQYAKQFQVAAQGGPGPPSKKGHRRHSSVTKPLNRITVPRGVQVPMPSTNSGDTSRRRRHERHHSNPTILTANFGTPQAVPMGLGPGGTPGSTPSTTPGMVSTPGSQVGPSPYLTSWSSMSQCGLTPDQTPPSRGFATYRTPSGVPWHGPMYGYQMGQAQPMYYGQHPQQMVPVVPPGHGFDLNQQQPAMPQHHQRGSYPGALGQTLHAGQLQKPGLSRMRSKSDPAISPNPPPMGGAVEEKTPPDPNLLSQQLAAQLQQKANVNCSKPEEF